MEDSEKIKAHLRQLFDIQKLAVLATHQSGQPYASLVAFAASQDLKHLFFATPRTTRKFANVNADARVALLVDSRSNREVDFHEAMAATATGEVRELTTVERRAHTALYLKRHPHLEEFVASPSCAFMQVAVHCYYLVRQFQKVVELHIQP